MLWSTQAQGWGWGHTYSHEGILGSPGSVIVNGRLTAQCPLGLIKGSVLGAKVIQEVLRELWGLWLRGKAIWDPSGQREGKRHPEWKGTGSDNVRTLLPRVEPSGQTGWTEEIPRETHWVSEHRCLWWGALQSSEEHNKAGRVVHRDVMGVPLRVRARVTDRMVWGLCNWPVWEWWQKGRLKGLKLKSIGMTFYLLIFLITFSSSRYRLWILCNCIRRNQKFEIQSFPHRVKGFLSFLAVVLREWVSQEHVINCKYKTIESNES